MPSKNQKLIGVVSDCENGDFRASMYFIFEGGKGVVIDVSTSKGNSYNEWRFEFQDEEMFSVKNITASGQEMLDSAPFSLPPPMIPELNLEDFKDNSLGMGDSECGDVIAVPKLNGVHFVNTEYHDLITFDDVMSSSTYSKKQKELVKVINYFVSSFYPQLKGK